MGHSHGMSTVGNPPPPCHTCNRDEENFLAARSRGVYLWCLVSCCRGLKHELCGCRTLRHLLNSCCVTLSELELEARDELAARAAIPFEPNNVAHEALLDDYRRLALGDRAIPSHDVWKELGFQSNNPRTDFRGGGLLSLECMTYFVKTYPAEFRRIASDCSEAQGKKMTLDGMAYSAIFVNVTFMLIVYLGINSQMALVTSRDSVASGVLNATSSIHSKRCFFAILVDDPVAFEELFSAACIKLFLTWRTACLSRSPDTPGAASLLFNEALGTVKQRIIDMLERGAVKRSSEFHSLYGPLPPIGVHSSCSNMSYRDKTKSA